jgi:hypothetical protein
MRMYAKSSLNRDLNISEAHQDNSFKPHLHGGSTNNIAIYHNKRWDEIQKANPERIGPQTAHMQKNPLRNMESRGEYFPSGTDIGATDAVSVDRRLGYEQVVDKSVLDSSKIGFLGKRAPTNVADIRRDFKQNNDPPSLIDAFKDERYEDKKMHLKKVMQDNMNPNRAADSYERNASRAGRKFNSTLDVNHPMNIVPRRTGVSAPVANYNFRGSNSRSLLENHNFTSKFPEVASSYTSRVYTSGANPTFYPSKRLTKTHPDLINELKARQQ